MFICAVPVAVCGPRPEFNRPSVHADRYPAGALNVSEDDAERRGVATGVKFLDDLIAAFGASAGVTLAVAKVGARPHICFRSRVTRGTHTTFPSKPARTKTQPALSTYCLAVKLAGGISAGPVATREPCAAATPDRVVTTPIIMPIEITNRICAPTH